MARWLLLVVAGSSSAGAGADALASVDASATVARPSLPAPKSGGKELQRLLEGDVGEIVRAEMEVELRDLRAFSSFIPEGGEYRLDVNMLRMTRALVERGGPEGATDDTIRIQIEAECTWSRSGQPLYGVPLTVSRSLGLDEPASRNEIRTSLRELFRELAQRSFADLYETRFYKVIEGGAGSGAGR